MRERKGERWRGREGGGVRKEKGREEKEESERMGGNGKGGRETGMQEDGGRERERVRNKERERGGGAFAFCEYENRSRMVLEDKTAISRKHHDCGLQYTGMCTTCVRSRCV